MDAMEMIYGRRSIRGYQEKEIPREVLEQVFAAAMMAPSWKNTQTASYVVATSPEMREQILSALPPFNRNTAKNAPVIVVMTTKHGRSGYDKDGTPTTHKGDKWEIFDAGIACQTLCLAAYHQGLGTCIMGIYDEDKLPQLLDLPEDEIITAVIPMGYPAVEATAPKRKSVEEMVRYV